MSRLIRMDQTGHTTLAQWTADDPEAVEAAQTADYVTFTSSSTVRNLVGIAGKPHAIASFTSSEPQRPRNGE